MLGADPMPESATELAAWIEGHPDVAPSPGMADAVSFLGDPPLEPGLKLGYKLLLEAAVATLPARLRSILGLTRLPGAVVAARVEIAALRWALSSSPSWQLALIRTGSPIPEGRFKQRMAIEA